MRVFHLKLAAGGVGVLALLITFAAGRSLYPVEPPKPPEPVVLPLPEVVEGDPVDNLTREIGSTALKSAMLITPFTNNEPKVVRPEKIIPPVIRANPDDEEQAKAEKKKKVVADGGNVCTRNGMRKVIMARGSGFKWRCRK